MPSSLTLDGNVPLADGASLRDDFHRPDCALFSAVDRIPLVKCWFCARIWHNMSRAASLMLRRGPCDCFIELCAAAGVRLALIVATATLFSSRCDILWLLNCCSPFHWSQILELSGSKDQRNVGDLAAWVYEKIVMARSGDHRPSVSCGINALGREKWNLLCFSNFLLKMPRARANVFHSGYEKDLSGSAAMTFHETRAEDENNNFFLLQRRSDIIFFNRLRVTHASFSNRHFVDSSIFHKCD